MERRRSDEGTELFRFPAAEAALARRLLAASAEGLFGFVEVRSVEAGRVIELERAPATHTVAKLARGERLGGPEALALLRAYSAALDLVERRRWDARALGAGDFVLAPRPHLRADTLLSALCRAGDEAPEAPGVSRWTPPAQAEGAPWDPAASRYVLGLVAHRLLTGELPFAGEGLRDVLAERANVGVPPFAPDVAKVLPPGLQALVLSLLDGRAEARPPSAAAIAGRCDAIRRGDLGRMAKPQGVGPERESDPPATTARRVSPAWRWSPAALGMGAALLGVIAAFATPGPSAEPSAGPAKPRELRALTHTSPADCAPCHAREVAEWERSVMAQASRSPLFGALESAVEEQVGRDVDCPNGAGVLRTPASDACRVRRTGVTFTGAGGEGWCINCHAPGENLTASAPRWSAQGAARSRAPLKDVLDARSLGGVSCDVCHQMRGPVALHATASARGLGAYEGNPTWTSPLTGQVFLARPEDRAGLPGISNSGYRLDDGLLTRGPAADLVHAAVPDEASAFQRSSEACGTCHDVRLFGTDVLGAEQRGEHFKRLRNAYSEWRAWADTERARGREPATCQGCHMSRYPGVCASAPGAPADADCPAGTRFEARPPSFDRKDVTHYFTSVEVPFAEDYPDAFADDRTLDGRGTPVGLRARRDVLLRHTFRLALDAPRRLGDRLSVPVVLENVGAGHKVPAGFSQEREFWIELEVRDAGGRLVYAVGKLDRPDEDLRDKRFVRVNVDDRTTDRQGRPVGVFGADVVDGPDVPEWVPPPRTGATSFRGKGLVTLQNGFLRCVRCIGVIDAAGRCQAGAGQGRTRADRYDDGLYDLDTGACTSNLSGDDALFETYYPIGALDADRGGTRAPDAILDTRSAPPGVPVTYVYELDARGFQAPFRVTATLHFRAFPPFLLRAFAAYETERDARGERPSGPQLTTAMLRRLEVLDLVRAEAVLP